MRQTNVNWIKASEELPTIEEFGPYPHVMVAIGIKGRPEQGHSIRFADLRFFGGDKNRPYWAGGKSEDVRPIENDVWFVEYWAPCPAQPTNNVGTKP